MGKPYSNDLRERVVAAVETGGLSCHRAAAQFGVGVSTAIRWVDRLRNTGSVAPSKIGGYKPRAIAGEHRTWLLARIKEKDRARLRIYIGAGCYQHFDELAVAVVRGPDQRGRAVGRPRVDVGAMIERRDRRGAISRLGRLEQ